MTFLNKLTQGKLIRNHLKNHKKWDSLKYFSSITNIQQNYSEREKAMKMCEMVVLFLLFSEMLLMKNSANTTSMMILVIILHQNRSRDKKTRKKDPALHSLDVDYTQNYSGKTWFRLSRLLLLYNLFYFYYYFKFE